MGTRSILINATLIPVLLGGCMSPPDRFGYDRVVKANAPDNSRGRTNQVANGEPGTPTVPTPLTLKDAVAIALVQNPDVEVARSRIRRAAAMLDESNAGFLPTIGVDTEFIRADAPSTFLFKSIDARVLAPGTDFNQPGSLSNFETGVGLRYNFYRGGRDLLRRWMALTGKQIEELGLEETHNLLVASVVHAFYGIQSASALVQTAQASANTVQAQHREAEAKWAAGSLLKSDVLSLNVRLAEAHERIIRADSSRQLATATLANLLGANADRDIVLSESGWKPVDLPEEYGIALAEALKNRPELRRGRKRVELAAMDVESAKRAFLPKADGSARVYWDDPDLNYEADRNNWVLGVTLSWNMYTGGSRRAMLKQARAVLEEMLHADRKETLAVQLDVKTAYLRVKEAEARLKAATAGQEHAQETLSLVEKQFHGGSATVTRYLEAELALTAARVRKTTAAYDLKKSRADVARALGWFGQSTDETFRKGKLIP